MSGPVVQRVASGAKLGRIATGSLRTSVALFIRPAAVLDIRPVLETSQLRMHRVLVVSALVLSGCGAPATTDSRSASVSAVAEAPTSLFPGDGVVLSDSAIARVLRYPVVLPAKVRVAILQIGGRSSYRWSANGGEVIHASLIDSATAALASATRIGSAAVLPGLLIPDKFTVPLLREAAARFQSDLVLVYRPDCETFRDSRLFSSTKVNASCSVEALVLDVRTGIVPFSQVATQSLKSATAQEGETSGELLMRAEIAALAGALRTVTAGASRFIADAAVETRTASGGSAAR